MMFQTNVGAMTDASSVAYLRPETAQGMFVDFKNVVDTGRVKLPFGIAQIGKSFRNEITPRNFIFRSREFEQMEMEYFIHEDADWLQVPRGVDRVVPPGCSRIGLPESHLSLYAHPKEKLAFYSKGTVDIMFKYPFGVQELWGIAARGNYDLTQHASSPASRRSTSTRRRRRNSSRTSSSPPSASTASSSPCSAPATPRRT
jgi:glycyl-tRNA synthetase